MTSTGQGRPRRAARTLALAAVAALALPAAADAAALNVASLPTTAPPKNRVQVSFLNVDVAPRKGKLPKRLPVRVVSRSLPPGVTAAAVAEPVIKRRVVVRFVIVNKGRRGDVRFRVRVGSASKVRIRSVGNFRNVVPPGAKPLRAPECGQARSRANRFRAVPGLRSIKVGARRFGAADALGAAVQIMCGKIVPSVDQEAASAFLDSVSSSYAERAGGALEGHTATWAFDEAGKAKVCVYVRGAKGGRGDVTISGRTSAFRLDSLGLAKVDLPVAGPGTYTYRVRWQRTGGKTSSMTASLTVPNSRRDGDRVVEPYAQAGRCAA